MKNYIERFALPGTPFSGVSQEANLDDIVLLN